MEDENPKTEDATSIEDEMRPILAAWRSISEYCRVRNVDVLIASKGRSTEAISALYRAGQTHFGENRVDELVAKAQELDNLPIKWHFIGHLQSNKCKMLASVKGLYMVESIDSVKTAMELDKCLERVSKTVKVLVQVNTTLREQFGILYNQMEKVREVVSAVLASQHLEFSGLMTIGDGTSECYARLISVRSELERSVGPCKVMSMGMSHDWKDAIEGGSTQVRVGRCLFEA
ncbi:hypothetical protein BEWA_023680 [Theileria equi strain WA]|uniref:Pyridoxal phosphate homeostasis protein n=1 Tax=Theileria equi strain WA TaxID=1537102 RepID=L0AXA0_THEEQ|nr:hypothetical protein BEWA_023680 [Theileria equi strain WA]AFZ79519.1 hypothetical protein BEWA_023680 [Theileria equi strain WA]|eukprot:XP_004829185.1 hypothetical protein BEWA_023680 [Theileria equi strain WA]